MPGMASVRRAQIIGDVHGPPCPAAVLQLFGIHSNSQHHHAAITSGELSPMSAAPDTIAVNSLG